MRKYLGDVGIDLIFGSRRMMLFVIDIVFSKVFFIYDFIFDFYCNFL